MLLHLLYGLEGAKQMTDLEQQIERQAAQLQDKQEQIEALEIIIENQEVYQEPQNEPEYIGTFTVTHYCPCEICCGKNDGITYTGTQASKFNSGEALVMWAYLKDLFKYVHPACTTWDNMDQPLLRK